MNSAIISYIIVYISLQVVIVTSFYHRYSHARNATTDPRQEDLATIPARFIRSRRLVVHHIFVIPFTEVMSLERTTGMFLFPVADLIT